MSRRDSASGASSQVDQRWSRLSALIAEHIGLHFPSDRLADLQRGIAASAPELGFREPAACADWLLSTPLQQSHLDALARHLTVGETYFFREKQTWAALSNHVLPPLIEARRSGVRRLRLWSAACCTGEEAYSLAILLHELLPDIADWQVSILATDINACFLEKAIAGTYRDWSFRDAPAHLKQRYFAKTTDGYAIRPEFKRLVTFEHLNLVADNYPSVATDTNAMDVILCRNVLMYFTAEQIGKVVRKLHKSLVDGGWLIVSPSEASGEIFREFAVRPFAGAILYQNSQATGLPVPSPLEPQRSAFGQTAAGPRASTRSAPWNAPVETPQPRSQPEPDAEDLARELYDQGLYGRAAEILIASAGRRPRRATAWSLLTRALANEGRLTDALHWCERWLAADRLHPSAYYFSGVVLMEQGRLEEARRALQRAVYLDPEFVLAHFALGHVARARGNSEESGRHFANVRHLLERLRPDEELHESDGLTVERLMETVRALAVTADPRRPLPPSPGRHVLPSTDR